MITTRKLIVLPPGNPDWFGIDMGNNRGSNPGSPIR